MTSSSASMAINAYIFFCYILFFSLNATKPFVNGASAIEQNTPSSKCSSGNAPGGLVIFHRHGSCSPPSQTKSSATASQMFLQDEHRVNFVNSRTNRNAPGMDQRVIDSPLSQPVGAGIYTVSVGFGTPVKNFNLILDTGSYITWVRCSPDQQNNSKLYNPSSSSTSSRPPCGSKCDYKQKYLDKSSSEGFFVLDRVAIEPDVFSNFVFLCAKKVSKIEEDGILGLGQGSTTDRFGSYSLISQNTSIFGQFFCHCLPTRENSGYVYFGKEALEKCQNSGNYTPLSSPPYPYYIVSLTAITIGKKTLEIASTISSSTKTIIDSGTVISRLPSPVYSALQSEFKNLMSKFPSAHPNGTLDTCYNLQGYGDLPTIPNMVLHFENLDVNLDKTALTWKGNGNLSQVCLAFAKKDKETDLTIIGGHQLQKLNVLYSIQDRNIKIGPAARLTPPGMWKFDITTQDTSMEISVDVDLDLDPSAFIWREKARSGRFSISAWLFLATIVQSASLILITNYEL